VGILGVAAFFFCSFMSDFDIMAKSNIDVDNLGNNPLCEGFFFEVTEVTERRRSGDKIYYQDRMECTKIFHAAGLNEKVDRLSATSQTLLFAILRNMKEGIDYIILESDKTMKSAGISSINTYKKCISELCNERLIYRHYEHTKLFWINPAYFFCGSRPTKYPDKKIIRYRRTI
jgi:hypothetical protein